MSRVSDLLFNFCGVACNKRIGWHIVNHHAAGGNGYIVADCNSREYHRIAANPAVVADGNRTRPFTARVALIGVGAVAGGVDSHVRTDETVIANGYKCLVEHGESEVGEEPFPHTDMLPVVAVERLIDESVVVTLPQNPLEHVVALLDEGGADAVVLPTEVLHVVEQLEQIGVGGEILLPGKHFAIVLAWLGVFFGCVHSFTCFYGVAR